MEMKIVYGATNSGTIFSMPVGWGGFTLYVWFRDIPGQLGILPRIVASTAEGADISGPMVRISTPWMYVNPKQALNAKKIISYIDMPKNERPSIHMNATFNITDRCHPRFGDCQANIKIELIEDWPDRTDDDNNQGKPMDIISAMGVNLETRWKRIAFKGMSSINRKIWALERAPFSNNYDSK